jgi:hypothetical protein
VKKPGVWKKILIAALLLLLLAILLLLAWASNTYNADAKKLNKFFDQNANSIMVNEYPGYWEIQPRTNDCADENCLKTLEAGLIFYPGARIAPQAYFYKLEFLANARPFKLKLFISKPPLRLAFFGINQADEIIRQNPGIKNWTIGGHSLGGAMACQYAGSHPEKIAKLFLLGA